MLILYTAVTRKDGSKTHNINLEVHDNTAVATLGLWGTAASSPLARIGEGDDGDGDVAPARRAWLPGETVLLLQNPGWKTGARTVSKPHGHSFDDARLRR